MARVTRVARAQQRFETVPVIDPATGEQKIIPVMRRDGSPKTTKKGKEIVRRVTENDLTKPLPNRECEKCGVEIAVGNPYKWIQPKSGPYGGRKRFRCEKCPSWKPSETTSSAALSCIYGAQEAAEEALNAWDGQDVDDVTSMLDDLASGLREGAECWRESGQNIEDGFGHETSTSQDLIDKADQMDSSADDVENEGQDLEAFDEDTARTEKEADVLVDYLSELDTEEAPVSTELTLEAATMMVETFDAEEYERRMEEAVEEARDEWANDIRDKASDIIGNVDIP